MEPTAANMNRILDAPPSLLPDLMVKVMETLRNEDTSKNFIHQYVLSPEKTADAIEKCLDWVLAGPDATAQELLDPKKAWQSQMMLDKFNIPPSVASKYGKRYFAIAQENAMWAVFGFVSRSPIPSRQFFLQLLQHKPALIDKLLDCANLPVPEWYPESQVDGIACESLAVLFQFPLRSVPGYSLPVEGASRAERDKDHQATLDALKIFLSRPEWRSKLLGIWTKIEKTSYQDIFHYFRVASEEYYAAIRPTMDTYEGVANNRGQCRIAFLRLAASLALVEDIKDQDLLSLLRPAYLAAQKWQMIDENSDTEERLLFFERGEEICRSPLWVVECGLDEEPTEQIPQEMTIGPITLVRVLLRLAQRGLLKQAQTWTVLPSGCDSSTGLAQIKQITSPAVLNKLLSVSVKRVTARRELGQSRAPKGDHWHTRSAYVPAAELASVLVQFDKDTNREHSVSIKGARKELVLCLNLAADVSMKLRQYEPAMGFSAGAVAAIENASPADAIPSDMLARIKRRIFDAKRNLEK
ncbi:hypothetical protein EUX98_g3578 [Antrodiella citrinella]|uniref:Uncharacterized protein n=1 Tax=Antrodiella citrinella TaxID=2447956 RepID=A0A4S4MYN4_9APHY|nr:hypothetical protein EUX98_g3578 [Antrodiella citrinella]